MRMILAALLAVLALPAAAQQLGPFDYLMITADQSTAAADPVIGQLFVGGQPRGDICIGGVQRWNTAQDQFSTDANGNVTVTHTFMPNWGLVCSFPVQQDGTNGTLTLNNHPATYLVTDRGAALAGNPFIVLTPYLTIAQLQALMLQPVPAGANYAFLNAQLVQQGQ